MMLATSLLLAAITLNGPNPVAPDPCAASGASSAADQLAAEFDNHQFVFIGSTHGDLKIEEFLRCLVSRPVFKQRATDIVVEWASSGQQRLLDRYLIALEEIPKDELAPIWFDTDYPLLWATLPQIRQFLQTLREVNQGLPAAKRIRLVAGNDGVDWTRVHVVEDLAPYPYKTFFVMYQRFPADIPWPGSLRIGLDERSERLADYIDEFVYLGPQPDKNLMGTIALTDAQKRELDRRSAITSEPQRMIRARLQGRDKWFSKHPDDFAARP
jgi:hypothetical protein